MAMANVHAMKVRWSKVKINADKDMNGKSLTNLNDVDAQIFSVQNKFKITKSPDRDNVRIITPSGYVDIGPENAFNAHFHTDRQQFYFDKQLWVNGKVYPAQTEAYDLGEMNNRWLNAWIGGNLGLGVIKKPGTPLTVDVIYDDAYVEVASKPEKHSYSYVTGGIAEDWIIGTLSTFTANGIITGIKIQIEALSPSSSAVYKFYEDGVEILSFQCGKSSKYTIYGAETNTIKKSAWYRARVVKTTSEGKVEIKNRRLYFKKRYLGIRAG